MDIMETFNMIIRGSFPAYMRINKSGDTYYESYIRTYLERDIETYRSQMKGLYKFLCVAAARTATTVNYNAMASECGITALQQNNGFLLVTSGLVVLIEPYFNNLLKRVSNLPVCILWIQLYIPHEMERRGSWQER